MNNKSDTSIPQYPGIVGEQFTIRLNSDFFPNYKRGQIIIPVISNVQLEVIKVYKRTPWRRLLHRLGFKTRLFSCKIKCYL